MDTKSLTHIAPSLTLEAISGALTRWFNEDITFTHCDYGDETGKGDSYLSEAYRLKIFGKTPKGEFKHAQVIIKTIPKNVCRRLTYRIDEFFKCEINFYKDVLPELLKFQASKNPKEPFDNIPKLFFWHIDGVNDVIVLEDLTISNFKPVKARQEGVDIEHCKVTLKIFAKFHALSFAMKDQNPAKFDEIKDCVFETYYHERIWSWYEKFWARLCSLTIDAVEKEYPNTIYEKKIKEFAVPETYKKLIDAATNTLSTGVISHGDSWTNNFLYKYEGEICKDAKMIDFQLSRCATPVLDISFFIYACTSQDLRVKHYEELMNFYYDCLSKQIEDLGSDSKKVYPKGLFLNELKKYSFFGLAFSMESTPFIIMLPEDAIPMDEMEGDEKRNIDDYWQLTPIKTKDGRLRLANNIVHAVDNGFI